MRNAISVEKGGRDAAFFFFLFLVATVGFGGSLQPPLVVLRTCSILAALVYLWRRRKDGVSASPYALLAGGFVLLALGHAFSSVYFWVSFQHAINILAAAVLLAWAYRLFRKDPEGTWRKGSILILVVGAAQVLLAFYQRYAAGGGRPHGTFDNTNFLAEFLAVAALLSLARLVFRRETGSGRLLFASAFFLFLYSALSLSGSRGVLLSTVPAIGLILLAAFGVSRGGVVFLVGGVPLLGLLGWGAVARFYSPDIYNYGRWIMWKSAVRTFLDHPFGVGLGGYKYYWYATQEPVATAFRKYGKFASTAHNEYLEVLAGLGAFGLLLFVILLVVPLMLAWKARRKIPAERREMAAAASACLMLSGIHAAFDFNFHEFGIVFVDALFLGALLALVEDITPGRRVSVPAPAAAASIPVLAALLVASILTFAAAAVYDAGEKDLRNGDESSARSRFHMAAMADPFRGPYPDALSALEYRRYAASVRYAGGPDETGFGSLEASIRFETRAASLVPRESKYLQRLSVLLFERFRVTNDPADMAAVVSLAGDALAVNPYAVEGFWHRSALLTVAGRSKEAVEDLVHAVNLEPNFCRGYAKLAEMAGRRDPAMSAEWGKKADACRKRAVGLALEDYEKWLVEDPGK